MIDGSVVVWAALIACCLDATVGYPGWIFQRIRHPVVWIGHLIAYLDTRLNTCPSEPMRARRRGAVCLVTTVSVGAASGLMLQFCILRFCPSLYNAVIIGLCASPFLAIRSLGSHVNAVLRALNKEGIEGGRVAVSMIVGRDVAALDQSGVSRAAVESLAENFSDGIVAPVFWLLIAGLPGLIAYKCINTADSMIGHKNERYINFGRAAALTDDAANFIPARLTCLLVVLAGGTVRSVVRAGQVAWRDGERHRSFNAGWPEGAMAGALDIRLCGPRCYNGVTTSDSFLNEGGREGQPLDISSALKIYYRACGVLAVIVSLLCALTTIFK